MRAKPIASPARGTSAQELRESARDVMAAAMKNHAAIGVSRARKCAWATTRGMAMSASAPKSAPRRPQVVRPNR